MKEANPLTTPELKSPPTVQFGFLEMRYTSPVVECADPRCARVIPMKHEEDQIQAGQLPFVWCFLDVNKGSIYCDSCGKCRRYARKKAVQRGDCPPEGPYPPYKD